MTECRTVWSTLSCLVMMKYCVCRYSGEQLSDVWCCLSDYQLSQVQLEGTRLLPALWQGLHLLTYIVLYYVYYYFMYILLQSAFTSATWRHPSTTHLSTRSVYGVLCTDIVLFVAYIITINLHKVCPSFTQHGLYSVWKIDRSCGKWFSDLSCGTL